MTTRTYGPAFDEALDGKRVRTDIERIRDFMWGNGWWTLKALETVLDIPQATISADLRHLRKERFGSYQVDKVRRGEGGTWLYILRPPKEPTQERLF